jgi:protein SCO1/2
MRKTLLALALLAGVLAPSHPGTLAPFSATAYAQAGRSRPDPGVSASQQPAVLKEIGIDQKLDGKLPLDAEFSDESGAPVKLGQFFGERPVVLALVYYRCPMLCTQVLNGLAGSLQGISFSPGKEYDVVIVSFDPGETPQMATERKRNFVSRYIRTVNDKSIHFLSGREESIKALTSAVGFRYAWDEETRQWAHPAAITIATADGRVSRYLYGVEFAPKDLKLAMVEASEGKIGTLVEKAMLLCFHYDPETGRYGFVIMNIVRVAGALTVLVIVFGIVRSLRRERRLAHRAAPASSTGVR